MSTQQTSIDQADVIVIQKKTALERYTQGDLSIDFFDYLNLDNQSKEPLQEAHETHIKSRDFLTSVLSQLGVSYAIFNLDELKKTNLNFYTPHQSNSGLLPRKKLVISLGGDGTLLHASHYVGADIMLLGINSSPKNSVGHLCAASPKNMTDMVKQVLINKKYSCQNLKRLEIKFTKHGSLSDTQYNNIPLALNDVLISHLHPAATSRYQISILDKHLHTTQCEKHLSSGLWISTAAGSTAAIASYGFAPEPLNSSKILVASRELYKINQESKQLSKFSLEGTNQSLSVFSRMRQGLVCIDGPDFSLPFGFGDTIQIGSSDASCLLLIK